MEYGNLAYKNYAYDEIPQKTKQKTKENIQSPEHKTAPRTEKVHMRYIGWILAVSVAAAFMVASFVTVKDTRHQVAMLQSELSDLETVTSQKAFELEKSVNLTQIEEEATSRLGMQRPESYQYVYVNVKQADKIEKTASGEEGLGKNILDAVGRFFGNIVNAFSIE